MGLEAPLILVELGAGDAAASMGLRNVAKA